MSGPPWIARACVQRDRRDSLFSGLHRKSEAPAASALMTVSGWKSVDMTTMGGWPFFPITSLASSMPLTCSMIARMTSWVHYPNDDDED